MKGKNAPAVSESPTVPSSSPPLPGNRWTRFFFTPSDPTTLGFMRIVTGVALLYIYSVYSLDLTNFFGRDAWFSLDRIEQERREYPFLVTPFGWDDMELKIQVPLSPDTIYRRAALVEFLRLLPADPAERKRVFTYISEGPNADARNMTFVLALARRTFYASPEERERIYDAVVNAPFQLNDRSKTDRIEMMIMRLKKEAEARGGTTEFEKELRTLDRAALLKRIDAAEGNPEELFAQLSMIEQIRIANRQTSEQEPELMALVRLYSRAMDGPDIPHVIANMPNSDPLVRPVPRPKEQRVVIANALRAFIGVLDQLAAVSGKDAPGYVLTHFMEMTTANRIRMNKWILDEMPQSPAERAETLEYISRYGLVPDQVYSKGRPIFSQWFHISSPDGMRVMHAAILFTIFLFTIGLWTRVTSVLTWLFVIGYMHRSNHVLFGMDTMTNILLIYLMLGPSGAALSVDRLRQRYRILRNALRTGKLTPEAELLLKYPPPSIMANFVLRLIQIHFCFIYGASGVSKLLGHTWWDHTATWGTLANAEFSPIYNPVVERMLRALTEVRWLWAVVMGAGVVYTLVLEIGFPFLVWTRLRPWAVLGGVLLHAGIAICMGLTMFSLLMMVLLASYFPGATIRDRFAPSPVPSSERIALRFNSRSERQRRWAARVRALDIAEQVHLVDTTEIAETALPTIVLPSGEVIHGSAAATKILSELKLVQSFRWVTWIPGVFALFVALYGPSGDGSAAAPAVVSEPIPGKPKKLPIAR